MYDSIVNSITRNVHRGFSAIFCEIANSVKLNIIFNMVECTFYKDFCAFSCKFQLLLMCNAATTNSSNILYTSHTSSSSSTTRSLLFHSALVYWGEVKRSPHSPCTNLSRGELVSAWTRLGMGFTFNCDCG